MSELPNKIAKTEPQHEKAQGRCIYCAGKEVVKKGTRKKKLETVQLWYCKTCEQVFTPNAAKGKTYPIPLILEGLNYFNKGNSLARTSTLLKGRFGTAISQTTISRWLEEHQDLCTYSRLREQGLKLFFPHQLIRSTRPHHRQVYHYRIHKAKLELQLKDPEHQKFAPIKTFLFSMSASCPHNLFKEENRGSQLKEKIKFNLEGVSIVEKENLATRITQFVLQGVSQNRRRHDTVQKFMLMNDSVTVATEVPVYLLPEDIKHLKTNLGFQIPLAHDASISGHIDALQIRNGAVHVLDYKPGAIHEKPIEQLTFYALALSRRTGLRVYDFKCTWFDEKRYFEFFPLHVVLKKRSEPGAAVTSFQKHPSLPRLDNEKQRLHANQIRVG